MFDREPLEFTVPKSVLVPVSPVRTTELLPGIRYRLEPIPPVVNGYPTVGMYPHNAWHLSRNEHGGPIFSGEQLKTLFDFIVKHYVSEMKSSAQVAPNGTAGHFCEGCGTFCAWVESNRPGGKYACPDCRNGGALARLI